MRVEKLIIWHVLMLCIFAITSCKQEVATSQKAKANDLIKTEPFIDEKTYTEKGEEFPVEVKIEIYEAEQLPIGEYYHDAAQLEGAKLNSTLDLTIGAGSMTKIYEVGIEGQLQVLLSEDNEFFDLKVELEYERIEFKQNFLYRFGQPIYFEMCEAGKDELVKVVVITVLKKGWKKKIFVDKEDDSKQSESILKPLKVIRSDKPVEDKEIKVRYYPLVQLFYDAEEIYKLKKVEPKTTWKNCDADDEIVNCTPWFNEVIGIENTEKLWVYYNISKQQFIAKSDIYLDTCMRHYVLQQIKDTPMHLRLTGEMFKIDIKASTKIDDVKKMLNDGNTKRLGRFSKMLRSGINTKISLGERTAIEVEVTLDYEYISGTIRIDYLGKDRSFIMRDTIELNSVVVLNCGLNDGDEVGTKTILVLKPELVDSTGRSVEIYSHDSKHATKESGNSEDNVDPFNEAYDSEQFSMRYKVSSDFEQLIIMDVEYEEGVDPFEERTTKIDPLPLVIAPEHNYFEKTDLVKDITEAIRKTGIPVMKNHHVYFNISKNDLCVFADLDTVDFIENLIARSCHHHYRKQRTHVVFYEVDSKKKESRSWDMTTVTLSNPKLMASGGFVSGSGEIGKIWLNESEIELESTFSDDGNHVEQSYNIDLSTRQFRLKNH